MIAKNYLLPPIPDTFPLLQRIIFFFFASSSNRRYPPSAPLPLFRSWFQLRTKPSPFFFPPSMLKAARRLGFPGAFFPPYAFPLSRPLLLLQEKKGAPPLPPLFLSECHEGPRGFSRGPPLSPPLTESLFDLVPLEGLRNFRPTALSVRFPLFFFTQIAPRLFYEEVAFERTEDNLFSIDVYLTFPPRFFFFFPPFHDKGKFSFPLSFPQQGNPFHGSFKRSFPPLAPDPSSPPSPLADESRSISVAAFPCQLKAGEVSQDGF